MFHWSQLFVYSWYIKISMKKVLGKLAMIWMFELGGITSSQAFLTCIGSESNSPSK